MAVLLCLCLSTIRRETVRQEETTPKACLCRYKARGLLRNNHQGSAAAAAAALLGDAAALLCCGVWRTNIAVEEQR